MAPARASRADCTGEAGRIRGGVRSGVERNSGPSHPRHRTMKPLLATTLMFCLAGTVSAAAQAPAITFALKNQALAEFTTVILLEPDNQLLVELYGSADLSEVAIEYRSEMLLAGDTIYKVDASNNVIGSSTQDSQTSLVFKGKKRVMFAVQSDGRRA